MIGMARHRVNRDKKIARERWLEFDPRLVRDPYPRLGWAMDRSSLLEFLADRRSATSDMPFDDTALVFRVGGKIFAIVDVKGVPGSVSLKCDPTMSGDLRAAWKAIRPGYHLNKEHWNTIVLDGSVPDEVIKDLVERSWRLVVAGLGATLRRSLEQGS